MSAAGAAAARGPLAFLLQSQTGQWLTISMGAMYAFPEQAKAILGDLGSYAVLAKQMSGFNAPSLENQANQVATAAPPQQIVIHQMVPSGDGKNQYVGLLIKVVVGGSACWIGYFALTNALPEYVQEIKKHEEKELREKRLAGVSVRKTPVSMIARPKVEAPNLVIRRSRADSDMDSLEDVHSVLGIRPGHSYLVTQN